MRATALLKALMLAGMLVSVAASNPAGAASTSLTCKDGKTITVSSGSSGGSCTIEADDMQDCMSAPGQCQFASCGQGNGEGWGGCDKAGKAYCGVRGCTMKLVGGGGTPRPPRPNRPTTLAPGILDNNLSLTPSNPSGTGTPMAPRQPTGPRLQ